MIDFKANGEAKGEAAQAIYKIRIRASVPVSGQKTRNPESKNNSQSPRRDCYLLFCNISIKSRR